MPGLTGDTRAAAVLHDVVAVHRLNYPLPVIYFCYATWGSCFAVATARDLLTAPVLLTVVANLLIMTGGLALNVVVDIPTDTRHREKGYLASAVSRLGRDRVLRWLGVEWAAGLALAASVSVLTANLLVVAFAGLAILFHGLYNVDPVRLKRRGFTGSGVFGAAMTTVPCVASYAAVGSVPDTSAWLVFAGVGLLAVGRTAWWSVPDRIVDTGTGMATPTVRYGVKGSLFLACVVMLAGLCLLGWGVAWRYGAIWVWPAVSLHLMFVGAAAVLAMRTSADASPSATRMQNRGMQLVMLGEVAIALIPLVAA